MPRSNDQWRFIILIPQFGLIVVLSTVMAAIVGYWLDVQFQIKPVGLICGIFIGFLSGLRAGWKIIDRALPRKQNGNGKEGSKK